MCEKQYYLSTTSFSRNMAALVYVITWIRVQSELPSKCRYNLTRVQLHRQEVAGGEASPMYFQFINTTKEKIACFS